VRRNLDELDARRLLTGGPLTIVTSSYRGRHNAAPIAYTMVLSIRPPMIGIAVHPSRYSFDIIKKTDEFALNIPTRELMHHAQYLGSLTGEEFDKLELTRLPHFRARKLNTVLLEGCVGWIECALEDTIEFGDHFLMIGRVVAVQADDDAFSDHWLLNDDDLKPLHYLGGNYYSTLSNVMEGRIPQRAEEHKKSLDEAVAEQLQINREGDERRAEEEYEREEFIRREGFEKPPADRA
jgi:flavin reductase (DIM6/NTAB) family NADH-FMN oxidoreductase RutF